MRKERNVRTGFFERDQIERGLDHVPPRYGTIGNIRTVLRFA
jgi:hypothetical protein